MTVVRQALSTLMLGCVLLTLALTASPTHVRTRLDRLMASHDCSTSGLAEGLTPAHALVRDGGTRVRVTTFEEGWEMYAGHRPGTLVAVCAA